MINVITEQQLKHRRLDRVLATWGRLFKVSHQLAKDTAEPMKQADLSGAQFYLMQLIGAEGGLTQQQYADHLSVTKGNICQHLDKLEKRRLIYREVQGREKYIFLSNSGRLILSTIIPEHDDLVRDIFSVLTKDEVKALSALLRKLR